MTELSTYHHAHTDSGFALGKYPESEMAVLSIPLGAYTESGNIIVSLEDLRSLVNQVN